MANRATQSLTTGMKILGGANIPTYTLEYLTSTAQKNQGSFETIVMPYVELGRDKNCGIAFGDDTPTVSRKHAAIERKGNETFIVNLSKSNPTLVNGRPVENRYFLNNGDEIQLSVEGPRLRYNTTKAGTAKIGFTNKMNLVMQQAIKPYKTAAISFLMIFIISMSGSGFAIYKLSQETEAQRELLVVQSEITQAQADSIASLNIRNSELVQSFNASQSQISRDRERMRREREQFADELAALQAKSDSLIQSGLGGVNYATVIEPLKPYVLAIYARKLVIEFAGDRFEEDLGNDMMCSGFMLEGGIFVTARHCFDAIYTDMMEANFIENSGGRATFHYSARSYDNRIQFDFTNRQATADYSQDELQQVSLEGMAGSVRIPEYFAGADWGYMQTSYTGGLKFDKELSANLRNGTDLFVLGYSYGTQFRVEGNLEPYFSTAKVTLSGLQDNTVHVTEAGWDGGNSGGPVFTMKDGEPVAIGLVTGGYRQPTISDMGDIVWVRTSINVVTPLINF